MQPQSEEKHLHALQDELDWRSRVWSCFRSSLDEEAVYALIAHGIGVRASTKDVLHSVLGRDSTALPSFSFRDAMPRR